MKKILSAVLALVMVVATFTMLVPNAVAAGEPQQAEAKVLYEENFDDLNGKTPAEILAGAGMTDERVGTPEYLSVKDGRLHYGFSTTTQNAYLILNDNDALASAYAVTYKMKFLTAGKANAKDTKHQVVSLFAYDTDNYAKNQGYLGWVSQMFYSAANQEATLSESYCFKDNTVEDTGGVSGRDNGTSKGDDVTLAAMKTALGLKESDPLENLGGYELDVKVVFATTIDGGVVRTYVKNTSDEYVLVSDTRGQNTNKNSFSNDLRLMISDGTVVSIDDMKVTSEDGTTEIYAENFDDIQANTPSGILNEIGWTSDRLPGDDDLMVEIEDGKLILGRTNKKNSDQEELVLVENDIAKNGYVIEYDVMVDASYYDDSAVTSFHSAPGDFSKYSGRQGWISQFRYNGQVLSGREENTTHWGGTSGADANTLLATASCVSGNFTGMKLAVKAVFDPVGGTVTTYVQNITSTAKVAWTDGHKVSTSGILNDADVEKALWTKYIRLVIYNGVEMSIDNIKITSLEKTPNVYGYQVSTANAANIRLLGVIDNDIFTKAEKVGFRVTMTKAGDVTATKNIDCEYVYSSITQWGADTPTQAAEMLYGASHIYALHVNGITEAVTITVTPYYVDEGVTYLGDAATIEYDPEA